MTASRFGVKNLIATHISPRFDEDPSPIKREIESHYSAPSFVAQDFESYRLKEGSLQIIEPS
ncbi:MAG: hypothetical protein GXO19_04550 [Epsilonproteobacteria bacterium]|nr:hypothetical protein [Campylobacterota bacterium]NPA56988.1 hypothetical protein [Campylobacterota bacterium]